MRILVRNAKIIQGDRTETGVDLLIRDGLIVSMG